MNHFALMAQKLSANARLEIYNAFQDRLTFLNRHIIVQIGWNLSILLNLLRIQDYRLFSIFNTLTGYRSYSHSESYHFFLVDTDALRKHGLFHLRYFENRPLEPGYRKVCNCLQLSTRNNDISSPAQPQESDILIITPFKFLYMTGWHSLDNILRSFQIIYRFSQG